MSASTSSLPAAAAPAPPTGVALSGEPRWSVRLLGAIEAAGGGQTFSRWPSRAVAALLARLALAPDRAHPREELVELLWPGVSLDIGRNRLRQALSTLKGLLEPPGPRAALVLDADRMAIRVLPGMIDCDVRRFEALVRAGDDDHARALYRGELIPGAYDDWVIDERQRLATLFEKLDPPAKPRSTLPALALRPAMADETVEPAPTGLPNYWTRIFGVELTASRLRALVGSQRLVTVHGPGGSGKTRLAVEAAQALRDMPHWSIDRGSGALRFDRIAFVPLVNASEAAQALEAICGGLHVDGSADARARIVAALTGRQTLLVLDNLEQLAADAAAEIARLLAAVPNLHVLVTSRRLLELDGECAFELEGLPLPAPDATLALAAVNPAVALFVDRARAARADFVLGARHVAAIVALVRLLGGMPLAIELAASRVRSLTPQELLQRLREEAGTPMLDLLARRAPRASSNTRHASMRHVVAWSWQQLTPPQAAMLQTLSVFAAPARTQAVAAAAAIDLATTQSMLDELRDASLVQGVEGQDAVTRYSLLQPVREFAAEHFAKADARSARQRLRHWLIGFARDAVQRGPAAVAPELAQVHAAIISAPADGASHAALELAVALRQFWETDNPPLSDLQALEQALTDARDAGDATLRTDALELLAYGRCAAGFMVEGIAHAEAALALAPDDRRRSIALVRWASAHYMAGRSDATLDRALDEASVLAQRSGDLYANATVLRMQSLMACNVRFDFARAEALVAQAQQLWERLGNRRMAYARLLDRAVMWAWLGRNDEAITVLGECERGALADGDWVGLMQVNWQQGRVFNRMRRWDDAAAAFRRSVHVGWQRQYTQGLASALLHLPDALVMVGRTEAAARLQGFGLVNWARLSNEINGIQGRELKRTRRMLRLRLGAARAEALRVDGSGMALADAVALAISGA